MRRVFAFLRRNAWLLVLGAVLEGVIGYQIVKGVPATYQATTLIQLAPGSTASGSASQDAQIADQLARNAVEALHTRPVLDQAAADAGMGPGAPDLDRRVSVALVRDTGILKITAEDTDPQRAAAFANAIPRVYSARLAQAAADDVARRRQGLEQLSELQRQQADSAAQRVTQLQAQPADPNRDRDLLNLRNQSALLESAYTATLRSYQDVLAAQQLAPTEPVVLLESALVPGAPIRPSYPLLTVLCAVMGAALATVLALARERLDDSLRNPERVRLRLNLPTLGEVSSAGRDYELLAGRCRALTADRLISSAVVTSATPRERASLVATNLSIALAEYGDRVLLVDDAPGHVSYTRDLIATSGRAPVEGDGYVLQHTRIPRLSVFQAGTAKNDSPLTLKSRIEHLPGQWETVLFDAPPVSERPDAVVLASYVEAVLVVVDPRRSSARATARVVSSLNAVGAQILGVVLNIEDDLPSQAASESRLTSVSNQASQLDAVNGSARDFSAER
jgi:capsular polysaccharide biosynthesis protein